MRTTRNVWSVVKPMPAANGALTLERTYSHAEFAAICEGLKPLQMEDKWFTFYEEPWFYVHRSWTGICMYQVRFAPHEDGVSVVEAISNRDPEQHNDISGDSPYFIGQFLDGHAGRPTSQGWETYIKALRLKGAKDDEAPV